MDLLIDILLDAGKDTLSLVPFLLVTYLALETLEHVAGDSVNGAIKRAGAAGPAVGSLLGMVPQCGFSAMAATLYAGAGARADHGDAFGFEGTDRAGHGLYRGRGYPRPSS